ncbi:sigma-70 family RNA polymerase sigma factor [Sphingomonas ginkgonis]|uniref:Sigma-70 family RNA polymerase sigma factor n=1 Tax=Sphingomonas ginkgonis TaxID=2315330 RepID=A0A3R9WQV9_9SPHN|nr:sigma-70 family RNA polymerase sigma factor [Sphingomonas ginkgonis]RST32131.1 sigma-70 family RNA polymerase sigma factor [Sphingomonas ginkgonis]
MADGDRQALQTVYEMTSAKLFGICFRILGDAEEAEDALQEVYVSLWRRAGSFDPDRASPISWLASFARNRAIDRLRSARRSRDTAPIEAAANVGDDRPSAFAVAAQTEEETRLHRCLDTLEEHSRVSIRTAFFDGLTYSQLAGRAEVPLGTMKSWIRRGLQQLRACLEA